MNKIEANRALVSYKNFYRNSSSELYHHGIKGQKWGIRRWQNEDGSLTKEGYEHYGYGKNKKIAGLSDQAIDALTFMATTAIVASPGILINLRQRYLVKHAEDAYFKKEGNPEKPSEMKTIKPPDTYEQSLKKVNPDGVNAKGSSMNCTNCIAAMEMRARGYDVQARKMAWGADVKQALKETFPKAKNTDVRDLDFKGTTSKMEKAFPNGSRGFMRVNFKGYGMGHVFSWEKKGGTIVFYDGQSGKTGNDLLKMMSMIDATSLDCYRLDNLEMSEDIGRKVVSVK